MNKKISFLVFFLAIMIFFSGCTIKIGSGSKGVDGGIWKSTNGANTWEQVVAVPVTGGKIASIADLNVRRMTFDPQDYNTIYLSTEKNGIVYTNDGGDSWQQIKYFSGKKIRSVAVDPQNKCNLYALSENKMYKSIDCGRFWKENYFHQNTEVVLTDILVDHHNSSIVYMTTSVGEVLKSSNNGLTWSTVYRADRGAFVDLEMNKRDSRIIYAATVKNGIFKTSDSGVNWIDLGQGLADYSGSHEYKGMSIDQSENDSLVLVSKFGMLKTIDGGSNWQVIELLPGEKKTEIYSLAVNSKNGDEIYYTTRNTLVKTIDGGDTWSSLRLPFVRIANRILINPEDTNILYLGTFKE